MVSHNFAIYSYITICWRYFRSWSETPYLTPPLLRLVSQGMPLCSTELMDPGYPQAKEQWGELTMVQRQEVRCDDDEWSLVLVRLEFWCRISISKWSPSHVFLSFTVNCGITKLWCRWRRVSTVEMLHSSWLWYKAKTCRVDLNSGAEFQNGCPPMCSSLFTVNCWITKLWCRWRRVTTVEMLHYSWLWYKARLVGL